MFSKEAPQRKLNHVSELKQNDVIVMSDSFGLPETLRAKQFQVSAVSTYEYEFTKQIEWTLQGEEDIDLFLSLDSDDRTYLKFSLKISHQDIESLFDLDDFSVIFEESESAFLTRQNDTSRTQQWSSEEYKQSGDLKVGYFHRKDYRSENISSYEGKDAGDQFELYTLFDVDDSRGIDVEVWQDGDTDVFLTLYRPLTDIVDLFPGS